MLGTSVVTGGLTIHYIAAARRGLLCAVGTLVSRSARQAVCTVDITQVASDGTATLVAVASGTVLSTERPAGPDGAVAVAQRLYDALAGQDVAALDALLDPAFSGDVSRGMPMGVGGDIDGPDAMIRDVWGVVAEGYDVRPVPDDLLAVGQDRVVVIGRYLGRARSSGRSFEAAFAHDVAVRDGRIAALRQITDTVPWRDALDASAGSAEAPSG